MFNLILQLIDFYIIFGEFSANKKSLVLEKFTFWVYNNYYNGEVFMKDFPDVIFRRILHDRKQ